MSDEPKSVSEPEFTAEEVAAARAFVFLQRRTFRNNLEYAGRVDAEFSLRPRDAVPDGLSERDETDRPD